MPDTPTVAPFKRAVLGLNGGPTDRLVVKIGCQLGRPFKAELVALHVVEIDWAHDLADDIASDNVAAATVLDMAEEIGEKAGVPLRTELVQARDVAAALVDEATEVQADLIVLGLPYRKKFGGDFEIGRTIPYVLENAPCQVIIVREPMAASDARAAERPLVGVTAQGGSIS